MSELEKTSHSPTSEHCEDYFTEISDPEMVDLFECYNPGPQSVTANLLEIELRSPANSDDTNEAGCATWANSHININDQVSGSTTVAVESCGSSDFLFASDFTSEDQDLNLGTTAPVESARVDLTCGPRPLDTGKAVDGSSHTEVNSAVFATDDSVLSNHTLTDEAGGSGPVAGDREEPNLGARPCNYSGGSPGQSNHTGTGEIVQVAGGELAEAE